MLCLASGHLGSALPPPCQVCIWNRIAPNRNWVVSYILKTKALKMLILVSYNYTCIRWKNISSNKNIQPCEWSQNFSGLKLRFWFNFQELMTNFRTIIVPEAFKSIYSEDPNVFAVIQQVQTVAHKQKISLRELVENLEARLLEGHVSAETAQVKEKLYCSRRFLEIFPPVSHLFSPYNSMKYFSMEKVSWVSLST